MCVYVNTCCFLNQSSAPCSCVFSLCAVPPEVFLKLKKKTTQFFKQMSCWQRGQANSLAVSELLEYSALAVWVRAAVQTSLHCLTLPFHPDTRAEMARPTELHLSWASLLWLPLKNGFAVSCTGEWTSQF